MLCASVFVFECFVFETTLRRMRLLRYRGYINVLPKSEFQYKDIYIRILDLLGRYGKKAKTWYIESGILKSSITALMKIERAQLFVLL